MKKLISALLWLFLLVVYDSYAQSTVRGSFCYAEDDKAADNMDISLIGKKSDIYRTKTDSSGYFSLRVPIGYYRLVCSVSSELILYQNDISIFSDTDLGVIKVARSIFANSIKLDEIVVKGNKPILTAKGDKLLFDVEHTALNTATFNALDVLKRTPLLHVNDKGGVSYNNTPVAIYINGNKLELPSIDLANYLKTYNATDIKAIEILPVSSAQYDASIEGAIVNIVTKSLKAGYGVNLSSGFVAGKSWNIDANQNVFLNTGTDKYNIYGSYGYYFQRSQGGKITSVQELLREETSYESNLLNYLSKSHSHSYVAGFTVQPSKAHRVGGEFYGNTTRLPVSSFFDNFNIIQSGVPIANAIISNKSYNKTSLNKYSGYYSYTLDTLGSFLKIYAGGLRQKSFSKRLSETDYTRGSFEDNKEKSASDAATDMQFYQCDFTKQFRSGVSISAGAKYTNTFRESGYNTDVFDIPALEWIRNYRNFNFNYREQVSAAYVSAASSIFRNGYLTAGLRMEYTRLAGNNSQDNSTWRKSIDWFPSLSYTHQIKRIHSFVLSANRTILRPSFAVINNYINKISEYYYDVGNPDLKPAFKNTISLRYNYTKHMLSATLNVYENQISTISQPQENGDIYNVTINDVKNHTYFILTYAYNNNIVPFWTLNGSLSGRWIHIPANYRYKRMFTQSLSVLNRFQISKNITMELNAYYISKTIQIGMTIAEQFQLDYSYIHTFFNDRLSIQINLNDLLNTQKTIFNQYSDGFHYSYYFKGVTWKVGLTLSYNFGSKRQYKAPKKENVRGYEDRL